jgi:glycyl-tRNA synthetase beta chain
MARTLLLEIGCEELPASFVKGAMEQLTRLAPEELSRARIAHGEVRAYGTPRRLALMVRDVAEEVAAVTEELLGPAESAAKGPDGQWTRAAEGFARKSEVPLSALTIVETPKGRYVRAEKVHPGGRAAERLPAVLAALVSRLTFPKSMRWADIETPFGRPVQWLVALFGSDVVPFTFVRLEAGRTTRGHRFLAPEPVEIPSAEAYLDVLRRAHVLADLDERRARQREVLEQAARGEGGELVRNPGLEDEVLGLVEEPFAVVGRFDEAFLALPDALIETVMSHHQRYFAVRGAGGRLLPVFITVVNTALDPGTIRKGNERVMRARLADARFFVTQDEATKLEDRVAKLDGVVYHQKLGTYGDKVTRLERLVVALAGEFGADEAQAARAARLSKADLVSLTVGEFPELQGTMGAHYARHDGEPAAVADAIAEHYQPRTADDAVAPSRVGAALAVADRLDNLVGFFAIGQRPSGGGDPFGLRRAAIGMLRTLLHHRVHISLATMVGRAYSLFERQLPASADETGQALGEFVRERLEGILVHQFAPELVAACLAAGHDDPVDVLERVEALTAYRASPGFARLVRAFERVFNISQKAPAGEADASFLRLPAERALLEAFGAIREPLRAAIERRQFDAALRLVAETLPDPVDRFFNDVFVMDPNANLRDARLRMLRCIAEDVGEIARFDTLAATL